VPPLDDVDDDDVDGAPASVVGPAPASSAFPPQAKIATAIAQDIAMAARTASVRTMYRRIEAAFRQREET
jgi:hypothetical protein